MIHLIFIIPYEELRPVVEEVLCEYSSEEEIITSIFILKSWEIDDISFQGDVIISRGFTAQQLKERYPELVCVPLKITGFDILKAAQKAIQLYNPRKMALIGSAFMVSGVENLSEIINRDISSYIADSYHHVPAAIAQAREDGCDCFLGGLSLLYHCGTDEHAVAIETGKPAIIQTIDEAIRLTQQTRIERNRAAGLRTIMNHSRQGIVFIDNSGALADINETAASYLKADQNWKGRKARELFPFLAPYLDKVEKTGAAINSEITTVDDQLLVIDFVPASRGGGGHHADGVILFIQTVSGIQKDESSIRKKIHNSKGLKAKYRFDNIIGASKAFEKAINQARQFACVGSPILIIGESGTGKELFAQSIHNASTRRDGPFVAINCAALSENLLESELFGYSEGSFTGAAKGGKAGLFEMAHGGSIFLDEISEIPLSFQSKLLRVLQENEVRRIGDDKVLSLDIRIITATNKDLREQVGRALFRQDLLFRLNVLTIKVPPLRERREDIFSLFQRCVTEFSKRYHKKMALISGEARRLLEEHAWEGNVRELRNIAERICVLNSESTISGEMVRDMLNDSGTSPAEAKGQDSPPEDDDHAEREKLKSLMEKYNGNRGKIAGYMGIDRSTLWRKLKKYRIQ